MTGPDETVLLGLEPWEGGKHERLWVLHQLNLIDKHCHLAIGGSSSRSVGWSPAEMMKRSFPDQDWLQALPEDHMVHLRPADNQFPLQDGDVVFSDRTSTEPNLRHEFRFDVALGEPEAIKGRPAAEVLAELATATREVVDLFR